MTRAAIGVSVLGLIAGCATAQSATNWIGSSPGVWSDVSGWDTGFVPFNPWPPVRINNNATVTFDIPTVNLGDMQLGPYAGGMGHLIVDQGEFQTETFDVGESGQGILEVSGTADLSADMLILAESFGSSGSMSQSGGIVNVDNFRVGSNGIGDFVLSDGLFHSTNYVLVAFLAQSTGVLYQTGGILEADLLNCNVDGQGLVWLSGGLTDVGTIRIGSGIVGPQGLLVVSDNADVQASSKIQVGYGDEGRLEITGGVTTTPILEAQFSAAGTAEISLQGGVLNAKHIRYINGTAPLFEMTGGTLSADTFGEISEPWTLQPSGGLILPHGDAGGALSVRGSLALGGDATIRYQLNEPLNSDTVIVLDDVSLEGMLEIDLLNPALSVQSFTLINNNGANPVTGTFSGLPEGAVIWTTLGGVSYKIEITYVGGDGNDVVVTITACLADINNDGILDSGDISAFVTLFLAGDLAVDFTNDGFLDTGDISVFVALFLAGC